MRELLTCLGLRLIVLNPCGALAEDEMSCSDACPDGKRLVSYADGNNTTCVCVDEASMDETVPDPSVDENAVNEDD